jgi:hypothetical protein
MWKSVASEGAPFGKTVNPFLQFSDFVDAARRPGCAGEPG